MKRFIKIYSVFAALALSMASCKGFLEEYSQNLDYLKSAEDIEKTMLGEAYMIWTTSGSISNGPSGLTMYGSTATETYYYPFLHVMDDDCEETVFSNNQVADQYYSRLMLRCFYLWETETGLFRRSDGIKYEDYTFEKMYRHIGAANALIARVPVVRKKGKDLAWLERLDGELHHLRASHYLILAGVYGLPYRKATASTDLCVPVKTSEAVEDKAFSRNTCAQTYAQIVDDLNYAAAKLEAHEVTTADPLRVSYAATQALLSRVHLYMENYEEAITAADNVIATGLYSVKDLTSMTQSATTNIIGLLSSETIFTQACYQMPGIFMPDAPTLSGSLAHKYSCLFSFCASTDLLNKFETGDKRRDLVFYTGLDETGQPNARGRFYPDKYMSRSTDQKNEASGYATLRLPEVLLNKAEALAMLGRDQEARDVIADNLIDKRFTAATAGAQKAALNALSGDALKDYIRLERRRELCFEGHRWLDLRRYQVNSVYPLPESFTLVHQLYAYRTKDAMRPSGQVVLESYAKDPGSWVIPIPGYEIIMNDGTLENFPRATKTIVQ